MAPVAFMGITWFKYFTNEPHTSRYQCIIMNEILFKVVTYVTFSHLWSKLLDKIFADSINRAWLFLVLFFKVILWNAQTTIPHKKLIAQTFPELMITHCSSHLIQEFELYLKQMTSRTIHCHKNKQQKTKIW